MNDRLPHDASAENTPPRLVFVDPVPGFSELIPNLHARMADFAVEIVDLDDELLTILQEESSQLVAELDPAIAARDQKGVRDCAHSITGMGGTLGMAAVSVLGEELSAAARTGDFARCALLSAAFRRWSAQPARTTLAAPP